MPSLRHKADTSTPGSIPASTIRIFSVGLQRRRVLLFDRLLIRSLLKRLGETAKSNLSTVPLSLMHSTIHVVSESERCAAPFAIPLCEFGANLDVNNEEELTTEYLDFEALIPEGQYGAGAMIVWDQGVWTAESGNAEDDLNRGELKLLCISLECV